MSACQSTSAAEVLTIDMSVPSHNADPGRKSVTYLVSSMLVFVRIDQRGGLRVSLMRGSDIVSFLNPEETLKDQETGITYHGV